MTEMRLADALAIRAVCTYLHENFPENRIVPLVERGIQEFRIDDIYGTPLHTLAVRSNFFGAHVPTSIPAVLRRYHAAEALRRAGRAVVEVTECGVRATGGMDAGPKTLPRRLERE